MNISKMSPAALRKLADELEEKQTLPKPLPQIDVERIVAFAKGIVDEVSKDDYCDDNDNEHWAFEILMEAVYGEDFWEWYNKMVK